VVAPFSELDKRATAEKDFVAELQRRGVNAVPAMTAMPPPRSYGEEEWNAAVQRSGADGLLTLTMTSSYSDTASVPGQTTTTGATTTSSSGNTTFWAATTRQDPGYYVFMPRVAFEMRLVDVASGGTAWLGTSFTAGDQFSDWNVLMNSLAGEAVARMAADGVVR
jgi:hypothetical protein